MLPFTSGYSLSPLLMPLRKRAHTASWSSVQTSPTQSHSPSPEPTDKKSKFEKQYDTANTSDADVLGNVRPPFLSQLG